MTRWYIMGTDLAGRICRVAMVHMPAYFTASDVLNSLRRRPDAMYRTVTEVEKS